MLISKWMIRCLETMQFTADLTGGVGLRLWADYAHIHMSSDKHPLQCAYAMHWGCSYGHAKPIWRIHTEIGLAQTDLDQTHLTM